MYTVCDVFFAPPRAIVFCYLAARCLSVAPKSLELWQNFLPKCRSLQLHQSREDSMDHIGDLDIKQINRSTDLFFSNIFSSIFSRFFIDHDRSKQAAELCRALKDPLTLAALELLGHSPRSGSAQVMEALLLRLRLEEVQIKPCNVWMTIIVIMFSF